MLIRFAETCSTTWISSVARQQVAAFQLSIEKLLTANVFHDIGAAQLTSLLKVGGIKSLLHCFPKLTNDLGIKPQSFACRGGRSGHGGPHSRQSRALYRTSHFDW